MANGFAASDTGEVAIDDGAPLTLREMRIFLDLLSAIDRNSSVSQRDLSRELGIAVGWINTYLKRCVRKGLVKMTQAPLNRYAYYLTPSGFHEKSKLTIEYLNSSFGFFRQARLQCRELFNHCLEAGHDQVALVGAGELAEIATLSAGECGLRIVSVIDAMVVAGFETKAPLKGKGCLQALMITDLVAPQETFERVIEYVRLSGLEEKRVLVPSLLNVTRGSELAALRLREA
ncbi:MarR family transcriptional regulator [uncultured Gammaproteobacteria bacterium]